MLGETLTVMIRYLFSSPALLRYARGLREVFDVDFSYYNACVFLQLRFFVSPPLRHTGRLRETFNGVFSFYSACVLRQSLFFAV